MKVKSESESEVAQSCPTLSGLIDCSRPGSSVHGIFQARVLEWGAIAFSEKNIYFFFIDHTKAFECVDHNKLWSPVQTTCPASWEIYKQVKKQQLEPDMEQQTGSKLEKEHVKTVYCHCAYLT